MPKKGYKQTDEHRIKLLGRIPWNKGLTKEISEKVKMIGEATSKGKKGIKLSKNHKKKISIAITDNHRQGKRKDIYKKMSESLMGHNVSVKTRLKISNTLSRGLQEYDVLNCNLRKIPEYKKWSRDVLEKDIFTCQKCDNVGGRLVAHHKKSFMSIIRKNNICNLQDALNCKELWSIDNGQTLCVDCHKLTNNYGSKGHLVKAKKL